MPPSPTRVPDPRETAPPTVHADIAAGYDRLVRVAAAALRAPGAVVSVATSDGLRVHAGRGISLRPGAAPPTGGLCARVAAELAPVAVEDARRESEAAAAPEVVAYAGVPLVAPSGEPLGVLCVTAPEPRRWTPEELELLADLAASVAAEVGLRAERHRWVSEEARLLEREARYRSLFEHNPDAVYSFDLNGIFTRANPATERLSGFATADLLGNSYEPLISPEDVQRVRAHFEAAARGEPQHYETTIARPDGGRVHLDVTNIPIVVDGAVVGVYGVAKDLTVRKRVEAAHAEALQRENAARAEAEAARQSVVRILESVTDMFFTVDRDWRFTYINRQAEAFFGQPRSELIGKVLWEQFPQAVGSAIEQNYRYAMRAREAVTFEAESAVVPGRWLELRVYPSEDGISVYSRDETERRQLREQLLQAQKMEAIGRLAGGVAHDFNNVLTAIQGNVQLLLEDLEPESAMRPELEEVLRSGERAISLTRQLLAFSRQQMLRPRTLNLNETVASMERLLRRLIGEHITFLTRPAARIGNIKADPAQLEQVILNLAVNARDAMPGGGTLTIRTGDAALDAAFADRFAYPVRPGRYVMLAVSDTGSGMSRETQERIFEPFFTTKEQGKGTGLGLSTVYGIVKQSGGYIWVYSEPERGTTFKIYLPRVEETVAVAATPEPVPDDPARCTETVLVVEDEPAVRALMRKALERRGYSVLEAGDGGEALERCDGHEGPIHVLVTDVIMPGMGGWELAERIAELRPDTRVLFTSGYTENEILRDGVSREGIDFLEKPFTPDSIARKVREVLARPPEQ